MSTYLTRVSSAVPNRQAQPDLYRATQRQQAVVRRLDAAQVDAFGVGLRRWGDVSDAERRDRLRRRGQSRNRGRTGIGPYDWLVGMVFDTLLQGQISKSKWEALENAADRMVAADRQLTIAQRQAASQAVLDEEQPHLTSEYREALKECNGSQQCKDDVAERFRNRRFAYVPAANDPGQTGPTATKGYWEGERENSVWRPPTGTADNPSRAQQALNDYGQRGIRYSEGDPDSSPFTPRSSNGRPFQTDIENMRENHSSSANGDYGQARAGLAREFPDWNNRIERGPPPLTPHHMRNGTTMQMVDRRIHNMVMERTTTGGGRHLGGASIVRHPQF